MNEQYLLPMARNSVTGQTVKNQDLTGTVFTQKQRVIAEQVADQLAVRMTARTGESWLGFVKLYTPTVRRYLSVQIVYCIWIFSKHFCTVFKVEFSSHLRLGA